MTAENKDRKILKEISRRAEEIAEESRDAIVVFNRKGDVLFCNRSAKELLACNLGDDLRHNFQHHFALSQDFNSWFQKNLEPKTAVGQEIILKKCSGETFPAEITLTPLNIEDEFFGVATIRDITHRVKLQEELQRNCRFLENILNSSAVAIFVIDRDHRVIFWNRACEELTGIKAEKILGTSNHWRGFYSYKRPCLADLVVEGEIDKVPEWYPQFSQPELSSEGVRGEGWFANIGGKRRYILFDAVPVKNEKGEVIAAVETLQDITERKLMEEMLLSSEERYRQLVEHAPLGVATCNLEGNLTLVNQAMLNILGSPPLEAILSINLLTFPPLVEAGIATAIRNCLEKGEIVRGEYGYRTVWGKEKFLRLHVSPLKNKKGEIVGAHVIAEDFTERRRMEEYIKRVNRRIQKELELANSVQASLLPIKLPEIPGVALSAMSATAYEVGGDYCDLIETSDGRLCIAIGDVMGKGAAAALFVTLLYANIRNLHREIAEPEVLLERLNNELFPQMETTQQFITLFYAIYHPVHRELTYANAGHNPPLIYRAATGDCETLPVRSPYLGGWANSRYRRGKTFLNPGDVILFYTDGLKEGMNKKQEQFGLERVKGLLKTYHRYDPASIQDIIISEFWKFVGDEPLRDDVTLIVMKVTDSEFFTDDI